MICFAIGAAIAPPKPFELALDHDRAGDDAGARPARRR